MPGEDDMAFDHTHHEGRKLKRGCFITFLLWLIGIGGVWGLGKLPSLEQEKWQWLQTALWMGLIFAVPAVGILQAVELKSYLDWSQNGKRSNALYRLLIILGSWLFAMVAAGVDLSAIAGVFENLGSHSGWQIAGLLVFCLIVCAVAVLLFWLPFMRLTGRTEAQERAEAALYREQMVNPDFASLEQQSGQMLPSAYRALFQPESPWSDKSWTLYPRGTDNDEEVYEFVQLLPAHPSSLRQHPALPGAFLCFGTGDETEYWLLLGPDDPPVFSIDEPEAKSAEDSGQICDRLSVFLNWPKEES